MENRGRTPFTERIAEASPAAVNGVRPRFFVSGFTLVEILVVLMIFGVLFAMAAAVTRAITAAQKRSITTTRMATVEAALIQFVQQQKRLPCPADGTKASSDNNAGIENVAAGVCAGNQANGVVPWRALGLSELDATDGWDRRLTYRVDANLAQGTAMNLSACDPAGSAGLAAGGVCNTTCSNTALTSCTPPGTYLQDKGLRVKNIAGAVLMEPSPVAPAVHTGAAYVLVSHGETGGGGYLGSGSLAASNITDGTEEMKNYASLPYVSLAATYYVDDATNDTSGATHFDDLVSHPSVMTVVSKAGLGPRSH